jgi:hypothetical protein
MKVTLNILKRHSLYIALVPTVLLLAGCPTLSGLPIGNGGGSGGGSGGGANADQLEYDAGLLVGFGQDVEYWQGFDDSYDTVDGGAIYYTGSQIPQVTDPAYDAGYYDGVWYAYNDGYFVAYDYAFAIGFSEGYDIAFNPNWENFLLADSHVEWLDGGFSDGYNDGFSEGRILGASDYVDGLPFDWLDALLFYQGTDENGNVNDIYFESLDLGTGVFGPVFLYEYGTDPNDLINSKARRTQRKGRSVLPTLRGNKAIKQADAPALSYRELTEDAQTDLSITPANSPRSDWTLRLETSWLDRVTAYNAAYSSKSYRVRTPGTR